MEHCAESERPYGNWLFGATALSSNNVWAVGASNNQGNTLILHWNGSSWSAVPSPNAQCQYYSCTYNSLANISAISASDVWAGGTSTYTYYTGEGDANNTYYTLFEHATNGSSALGILYGVAVVSSSDVWAVGLNLTERYTIP
jgi:hypothetical protein